MDNLTHSLIGAALGQAGLKRKTGLAMPALIIGANIPDIDAGCVVYGVESLAMRRGITHGPIAWVVLPLLLAGGLWWFDRWQERRGKRPEGRAPVHFGWLWALSLIATLSHPLFDWFNVYGVRLLEPFSSRWFYGDTLFIIDPWIIAMLGAGVWFSLRRERSGGDWKRPACLAILLTAAYVSLNGLISWQALTDERFVGSQRVLIAAPLPFKFWTRELIVGNGENGWSSSTWKGPPAGRGLAFPESEICQFPEKEDLDSGGSAVAAFMFWSRAPFAEEATDGSVVLRDARFYDPRVRDRFSVNLPNVECYPLRVE